MLLTGAVCVRSAFTGYLYLQHPQTACKGILYNNINVLLNYDRVLIQCTFMCFSCYIRKQLHCVSVCYHEFDTLNSGHDQFQLILLIIDKVLSGQLVERRRCTGCFLLLIDNETRLFPGVQRLSLTNLIMCTYELRRSLMYKNLNSLPEKQRSLCML